MKKLGFAVAVLLLFTSMSMAGVDRVNLTLITPDATYNRMSMTLRIDDALFGTSAWGYASDTQDVDLTTASGQYTELDLNGEYNNLTGVIISTANVDYQRQVSVGPIDIADTEFTVEWPGIMSVSANFAGLGANMDTISDAPGSTFTAGGYPGTDQRMYIDKGIFTLGPPVNYPWNLAVAPVFSDMVQDASISVSKTSTVGRVSTYDVVVEQPVDFFSELGGTADIDLTGTGTLKWTGTYSRTAPLPGDTDDDGNVDTDDRDTMEANWLSTTGTTWAKGDFNYDGVINDIDATLMAANWGTHVSAVPEPTTVAGLLALALAGLALWRRR